MARWVQFFGDGEPPMRPSGTLGEKGDGLAALGALGVPTPPGFIVTAEAGAHYRHGAILPDSLRDEIAAAIARLATATARGAGDGRPLLLAVRASPQQPSPGVMDTVLNLGLNDRNAAALAAATGDPVFAYGAWRRFLHAFATIVLERDPRPFEEAMETLRPSRHGGRAAQRATAAMEAARIFRDIARDGPGGPLPEEPEAQLHAAVTAAFRSWHSPRARAHRELQGLPDAPGLAVIVQAMVFGTLGAPSGTGIAFSRDPATGEAGLTGEFVPGGQGDEALAGLGSRRPLTDAGLAESGLSGPSFAAVAPAAFAALRDHAATLERHYRDIAELSFTVERGKLHVLQARPAKRGLAAAVKTAVALAEHGAITRIDALLRIDPAALDQFFHPTIAAEEILPRLATALPASPGAATGIIAFDRSAVEAARTAGRTAILVVSETTPEDVHGMQAAAAILTLRGGLISHAAVVARGLGKPCVSGAAGLRIDREARTLVAGDRRLPEGSAITLDGSTGEVFLGEAQLRAPQLSGEFATLMQWADAARRMKVRANADTPGEARTAFGFGAEGIGLCRTEHMFFDERWIVAVRELILADDAAGREAALARLLPPQRRDIAELFRIAAGRPVTIRLLDPPLHEFLPRGAREVAETAEAMGIAAALLQQRAAALAEFNPMLGLRGCRLAITFPEIIDMQTRAVIEAAIDVAAEGVAVTPEIMVPLVASRAEMAFVRARVDAAADLVAAERGVRQAYSVGTMIELPRAALRAGAIADVADFFSFGTNDLTQTTYGISRDDAGSFLGAYARAGIFPSDPFASIDRDGVGELMRLAVERGRAERPALSVGICGEHGGEPDSIAFCEELGLDYVSCSPFRVPVARLAAAQAAIRAGMRTPE